MKRAFVLSLVAMVAFATAAGAQPSVYSPEATFSYDQRLGTPVPPELAFRDEQGQDIRLGDFYGKRPLVLALVQYRCPMLCNQVLNGLVDCLRGISASAGVEFDVVVVSFDPRETPELAAKKKAKYVEEYGRAGAEGGWHFLTGPQESIDTLTLAVGFQYAYSQQQDRFAHPSGVVVLTPEGKVSAYHYGILYAPNEMRASLSKAAAGQIGDQVPTYRRVLLLCYDYDASTGGYSANVMKMVRAGGVVIVLVLGIGLTTAWMRERRATARRAAAATGEGGRP